MQANTTDDLQALLDVFPTCIQEALEKETNGNYLIEVVLDLGRRPKAYFSTGEIILNEQEITQADINAVVEQVGEFMGDNRAGIERTLHRISGMRNRRANIIGLTCRVGRAVYGTIDIMQDLLDTGRSVLLLGRPGVGKTTLLREAARIISETKRVIVVDTSNEIAGDGDIPHPAIGKARRMQVPSPELQHHVMIEAVENHTPQVIIIDEIGRLEEAEAARTIAERGVQLIGTAHGNTLDNLLVNPILADLVGGIDSVTLSDEEARRRNTQKSVLERRSPPTFDILVEIQGHDTLAVHHDVARAVDNLLRGRPVPAEIRSRDDSGEIKIEVDPQATLRLQNQKDRQPGQVSRQNGLDQRPETETTYTSEETATQILDDLIDPPTPTTRKPIRAYTYGANQNRLRQVAKGLRVPLVLVDRLDDADVFVTLKSHYRKQPQPIVEAEQMGKPLYVLRANTVNQIESCLVDIFSLSPKEVDPLAIALREAQDAIQKVLRGAKSIQLTPQMADIRKQQHALVRKANLISHSHGREPHRGVRIYRQ